jgi:hypothetical protein
MSEREENRVWLERDAAQDAHGWAANAITNYGMAGALDVIEVQAGRPFGANLSRRPFCNDPELKDAIYAARDVVNEMCRRAYQRMWADGEALRDAVQVVPHD